MRELFRDFRLAGRRLLRQPLPTAVVILTLALGLGMNGAVSSVLHAVLVDPLPFDRPQQLIALTGRTETAAATWVAYREFLAWQERNRTFESLAAHRLARVSLTADGDREGVIAVQSSSALFAVLGVEPLLGRVFTDGDDRPGGPQLALVSHGFWQRRLGGRREAVGEAIELEGEPWQVIGVMKPGFVYPTDFRDTELWLNLGPLIDDSWGWDYTTHGGLLVTGRLRAGVGLATARSDLERVASELAAERPATHSRRGVALETVRERTIGELRPRVLLLAAAALLVLAVTCVNVANLLLARAESTRRELGMRRALGASSRHLVRQLVAESLLLALAGAAAGLAVARWTLSGLLAVVDVDRLPAFGDVAIDGRIVAVTLALAIAAGLGCGLAPAWLALRGGDAAELADELRDSGRRRRGRVAGRLVVAEVTLALVLLISALLTIRSFRALLDAHPGFEPGHLLTFLVSLPEERYPTGDSRTAFFDRLLVRLGSLPGVTAAATGAPIAASWPSTFELVGDGADEPRSADLYQVSRGYFETMGIRRLRGRVFEARDRAGAPPVVVVDELFADTFLPGREILGRRIRVGGDPEGPRREVVGVVAHADHAGAQRPGGPAFYQPAAQTEPYFAWVIVRSAAGNPMDLAGAARAELATLDREVLVDELRTMDDRMADLRAPERLASALLGAFAALVLVLTAVGVYGVLAWSVAARRREIGVRRAFGARARDVFALVLRRALGLTLTGVALGWVLSLLVTRLLASQLFGVTPWEPAAWLAATLVLTLAALLAAAVPARRASRVAPLAVLRQE